MPNFRIPIYALTAMLATGLSLYGQTYTVLHNFSKKGNGGNSPESGVIVGPQGELYGTTPFGGTADLGVVYELLPPASPGSAWTEVLLHSFGSQGPDQRPAPGLLLGPSGVLYGATGTNGVGGYGTVFQLQPPVGSRTHWSETVLYDFTGANGDGENPNAALVFGPGGILYGVTSTGTGPADNGSVFSVSRPTSPDAAWTEAVLYGFPAFTDGDPVGSPTVRNDGTVYGAGQATVFELSPPSTQGGSWTETTLHTFLGEDGDGDTLVGGVTLGPNGALYGTTELGGLTAGTEHGKGCGIVYELDPPPSPGDAWSETILHTFAPLAALDGCQPSSTLVRGAGGVLYGTTGGGGANGEGTIFEMIPPASPGGAWAETVLYSFLEGAAGGLSPSGLALGPNGALYGTTLEGGEGHLGTVFEFVP